MNQSLIREIKQNWQPNFTGARKHVSLVIKEYSQLDKLIFYKQLDVTLKGLVTAGFQYIEAEEILLIELFREKVNVNEWLNGRTASEIISNN